MVGRKSAQTRVSRDNNRQDASYNLLSSNSVSMKKRVGMHIVCYFFLSDQSIHHIQVCFNTAFTISAEMLWGVAQCMGVVSKLGNQSKALGSISKRKIITRLLGYCEV